MNLNSPVHDILARRKKDDKEYRCFITIKSSFLQTDSFGTDSSIHGQEVRARGILTPRALLQ